MNCKSFNYNQQTMINKTGTIGLMGQNGASIFSCRIYLQLSVLLNHFLQFEHDSPLELLPHLFSCYCHFGAM